MLRVSGKWIALQTRDRTLVKVTRTMLHNYKSIAWRDVALAKLHFLLGANGAGKSNFVAAGSRLEPVVTFTAQDMSDGSLRARAILCALF